MEHYKEGDRQIASNRTDPSLVMGNEKLKEPESLANAFNNYFLTVAEQLNVQKSEKGDAISLLKESFPGNFPSIKIIPFAETKIKCVMLSPKPKNNHPIMMKYQVEY